MSHDLKLNWTSDLPFGLEELKPDAHVRYRSRATDPLLRPDGIACCVRGCSQWLPKRRRGQPSQYCPVHGISISSRPSYVYRDRQQNFIVGVDLLDRVTKSKVECWRLGNETSEDALSWNVFVGLLALGGLAEAFQKLTGITPVHTPELYLWGNRIDETCAAWSALKQVRERLESGFRIPTEPDVMLRVPGQAIVLIEAKFGSLNGTFKRKKAQFGSIDSFLERYEATDGRSHPLSRAWIREQSAEMILEQLCRNVVFAQHLAAENEQPFVINLVRSAAENDEDNFRNHLSGELVSFYRRTWEELADLRILKTAPAKHLRRYLENKTIRLQKAFSQT